MGQSKKQYVCLTATLGTERVAATLAYAVPVSAKRLAAHCLQQPETEILELMITGCLYDFHWARGKAPRLPGGPQGETRWPSR